jgi:poly(glycerol-phosphate) alpha-glucosyltransferase
MARGCPAIAYDIAYGPGAMISHEESGLLVPPGDIRALADAVSGLLGDRDRIARFSRASLAWARSDGPDRGVAQWRELLGSVTAHPPRVRRERAGQDDAR